MARLPVRTLLRVLGVASALCALVLAVQALGSAEPKPLRVFLLVGQSNMEGKGAVEHLRKLATSEETREDFGHLLSKDGEFVERDDVWISYKRKPDAHATGGLTVGYGGRTTQIGPELGFGTVVGDQLEERVLLIKCAWGGASLAKDFLPPGSGGPGGHYERMLAETREVLADLKRFFPEYDESAGHEVSGLVWFQGWNDHVGKGNPQYTEQLAQFIRDVRKEFDAPKLPVVIGELGQAGVDTENETAIRFRAQQRAVADMKEFEGTVTFVETARFIDPKLHEQFAIWQRCNGKARKAETEEAKEAAWADWREVEAEYSARTSDRPYHYFGSGEVFYRMGDAFGRAMVELVD